MRLPLLSALAALTAAAPAVALAQGVGAAAPTATTTTTSGSPSVAPAAAPGAASTSSAAPSASATPATATPSARNFEVTRVAVPGVGVQAARVTGEFNAPFEVVARVALDFPSYHEFLPHVRESRVVQRRRGQQDVYLSIPLMDGFPGIWVLDRFDIQRTPTSIVVDGHMVNGNMTRADVRIEAAPIAGTDHSRVTLQVLGIPSFPLPGGFLSNQQARWGTRGITALRERAEQLAGLAAITPPSGGAATHPHPAATTQRPDSGGGPPPAHN